MAFRDEFVTNLQVDGITISASSIPEESVLRSGLDSLRNWLASLDADTRLAVDEVSADFPIKVGFADDTVGISPGLNNYLSAVDQLQADFSISTLLNASAKSLSAASEGNTDIA